MVQGDHGSRCRIWGRYLDDLKLCLPGLLIFTLIAVYVSIMTTAIEFRMIGFAIGVNVDKGRMQVESNHEVGTLSLGLCL